jgi:cell division protein FtsN
MAQRKRTRRRINVKDIPGWLFLVFGLALGIATVLLTQLFVKRSESGDGIAGLLPARTKTTTSKAAEPSQAASKKSGEAPKETKPKFDFYTILPEIETVLPEKEQKSKLAPKSAKADAAVFYVLQAGSFANYEDADQLKARLALLGLVAQIQKVSIEGKGDYHRVRLGPYDKLEDLDVISRRLQQNGIKALRLKLREGAGT